jgi:hypothetical protein
MSPLTDEFVAEVSGGNNWDPAIQNRKSKIQNRTTPSRISEILAQYPLDKKI